MAAEIYIVPLGGQYQGKLLVFDTVEAMTITNTSKIPQHPVESLNRSSADHRFRDGTKIQLTGAISDNWNTQIKEEPTPVFQTSAYREQAVLRTSIISEFPRGTLVNKVAIQILDKQEPDPVELGHARSINTYWIAQATRIVEMEEDDLERARDKQLSLEGSISNNYSSNDQINTIQLAKEMLQRLDENSTLVTVFSMHRGVHENMVISNFTNILRNGAQRGAYWVSLSLEQQLLAKEGVSEYVIDPSNTEAASSVAGKGKRTRNVINSSDTNRKKILEIWEDELTKADNDDPNAKIRELVKVVNDGETAKDQIIKEAFGAQYLTKGGISDEETALTEVRLFIKGALIKVKRTKGKI